MKDEASIFPLAAQVLCFLIEERRTKGAKGMLEWSPYILNQTFYL